MNTESPLRVLVAEDVLAVRESVLLALRAEGIVADAVTTGAEALRKLRAERYDVLVTDIWMPDTDGLTVIKDIGAEQPDLRVFAMTGGGPRLTIETALSLAEVWGAERVFVKPFNEDDLVQAIQAST